MFIVYYNSQLKEYKLREDTQECIYVTLATFKVFDMAYDYITRMNHAGYQQAVYSRWTR